MKRLNLFRKLKKTIFRINLFLNHVHNEKGSDDFNLSTVCLLVTNVFAIVANLHKRAG